jgi:ferredoxin
VGPNTGRAAGRHANRDSGRRLRVDFIACDGAGLCAELLPELISRDEWGYPVITDPTVPDRLRRHARQAVRLCPKLALRIGE